jgi:putative transposase
MKRSRFTEEQIIGILKEHQAGLSPTELCRKHAISDATFYTWRKKYGGMDVSDARRLKALEEENAKLKKLLAEPMIDVSTLREMLTKKILTPGSRRRAVNWAIDERGFSQPAPAGWWESTRVSTATGRGVPTIPGCASGCASWRLNAGASAIGVYTSCCSARAWR